MMHTSSSNPDVIGSSGGSGHRPISKVTSIGSFDAYDFNPLPIHTKSSAPPSNSSCSSSPDKMTGSSHGNTPINNSINFNSEDFFDRTKVIGGGSDGDDVNANCGNAGSGSCNANANAGEGGDVIDNVIADASQFLIQTMKYIKTHSSKQNQNASGIGGNNPYTNGCGAGNVSGNQSDCSSVGGNGGYDLQQQQQPIMPMSQNASNLQQQQPQQRIGMNNDANQQMEINGNQLNSPNLSSQQQQLKQQLQQQQQQQQQFSQQLR
ncbi:hypothetical protein ACHAXS_011530 [Conticribra weissflogii]